MLRLRVRVRPRRLRPKNTKPLRFLFHRLWSLVWALEGVVFVLTRLPIGDQSLYHNTCGVLQSWQPYDMPWSMVLVYSSEQLFQFDLFWLLGCLASWNLAQRNGKSHLGKKIFAHVEPGGSSSMHSHAYDSMPPLPGHCDDELVRGDLLASWHQPHDLICYSELRVLVIWTYMN